MFWLHLRTGFRIILRQVVFAADLEPRVIMGLFLIRLCFGASLYSKDRGKSSHVSSTILNNLLIFLPFCSACIFLFFESAILFTRGQRVAHSFTTWPSFTLLFGTKYTKLDFILRRIKNYSIDIEDFLGVTRLKTYHLKNSTATCWLWFKPNRKVDSWEA